MDAALRQATPFGKYVLLERVSVGGMAEVFKAKAFGVEGFEKILAIKCILPSMAEDADFIEMFIDEAKICGQLNHANICQIYELGRVGDSHFIAMEYVWGKDVLQMQNRFRKLRQKMKPEMAAYIVCKICEGLDYAHKKKDAQGKALGIIHRDISPQNVLVSYEGELKVIDFGIAKAASRSSKTQAGVLKGKFGYMSPEQVRGLPLDRRSDLFAIGTLLYELLTSERLFYGESDFETLEKVRNVDVAPPSSVNPAIPKSLERIIMRALSKDVEGRYQWASEMAEELNGFLLSQETVFSAQNLSQWMREQFSVEMQRERLVLDEQQKVTRDLLAQGSSAPIAVTQAAVRPPQKSAPKLSKLPPIAKPEPVEASEDEDDFNEKTTVSGPAFGEPTPTDSLPEQSTRILDGGMPGANPLAALLGAKSPSPAGGEAGGELAAQATVVFSEASGQTRMPPVAPAPLDGRPYGGVIVGDPSQVYPPVVERSFTPHYGQLMPPGPATQPRPPRSTMGKDILIGVAVAAAVVGCILGLRLYVAKRGEATLVVVSPTEGGELLVDGASRGKLAAGAPLTIKAMASGEHSIMVRGEAGEFQQSVTLAAGDVNVVTATFSSTAPQTGKLKLEIEAPAPGGGPAAGYAPTTADVYVDGAQISSEAARTAISLRVGPPHEIRVSKSGYDEKRFSIDIKAGETMVRPVRLDATVGNLAVTSEPAGAEVTVNGRRIGLTPTTVSDLEPGHSTRISFRLSGYQSVTKTINYEKSSAPQTLDVHLVAGKDKDPEPTDAVGKDAEKTGDKPTKNDRSSKGSHSTKDPVVTAKGPEAGSKEPPTEPAVKPSEGKSGDGKPSDGKPSDGKPSFPADGLATVSFGTDKDKGGAQVEPGYLVANTQPWAKVIIDGKDTGKTTPIAPRSKIALKPGKHTVTFVVSGKKYNYDIAVKPGEEVRLIKQLSDAAP